MVNLNSNCLVIEKNLVKEKEIVMMNYLMNYLVTEKNLVKEMENPNYCLMVKQMKMEIMMGMQMTMEIMMVRQKENQQKDIVVLHQEHPLYKEKIIPLLIKL